ncbi:metal-sensitive transcriptional regulator [Arthrobacter pityocampae]|uniref:metal-sensitive transcriptional regulator n=1 Tax=Arthrobacter pityocampae TaxID=547334 RepID=UPI003737105D
MPTHAASNLTDESTTLSTQATPHPLPQDDAKTHPHGYAADKGAYVRRLKRIEGQVRGIARMIDEDKYCIDILTQVAAVNSAMHALSLGLLESHLTHCVADAAREAASTDSTSDPTSTDTVDAKIQEATQAIGRLLR